MKKDPTGNNQAAVSQMKRLGVNFSTARELIGLLDSRKPALRFSAGTSAQWRTWRKQFLARVNEALGPDLPKVAPRPRVVEKIDAGDHWRYQLVYRTTARMSAPGYLLVPKSHAGSGARLPAVLTIHGHGHGGCDLVGLSPEEKTGGNVHHNYALSVVRRGMVAFAPELRGFGQRAVDEDQLGRIIRERGDPEAKYFRRDLCNVQDLKANLLGTYDTGVQDWAAIEAAAIKEGTVLIKESRTRLKEIENEFEVVKKEFVRLLPDLIAQ